MVKTLSAYMTTYFNSLLPKQQAARDRVIFAINDLFGLLFDAAAPVKRQVPNAAPTEGACAGLMPPAFTLLREQTSRGRGSLLGRVDIAFGVPRLGGGTAAAKPLKGKANTGGAHPRLLVLARMARRRRGLSCQVWSGHPRRKERSVSLGGGNNAPTTTARTRTILLR